MKEFLVTIKNSRLFTGVSETEIEAVLSCLVAERKQFQKNTSILRAGDTVTQMGMLLAGNALVMQEDFWGNRNIIAQVGPGQLFAEAFACAQGAVLNVSVMSDSPCIVLWLDVRRILTICPSACGHHSRIIHNLLCDMAEKNLRFNEKLTHMGQRCTRGKLLSYLSAQAQRQGSSAFDIPFNRQQLADYLSVERSAMSAELSKLRNEGLLTFEKNRFVLTIQEEGAPHHY